MPLQRWTLDGMTFPVNPERGVLPSMVKNVQTSGPVAYNGSPMIWEGREQPREFNFEGAGRTQAHYQFMVNWYNSLSRKTVVDELNNTFTMYLVEFSPERRNRTNYKWSFTYKAKGIIC